MEKQKLRDMGFMEPLFINTPNGGDAAEAYFFSENWEYTTKDNAVHIIIQEFKNGVMIKESYLDKECSSSDIRSK